MKYPDWVVYITNIDLFTVLEAGSPRLRCWHLRFLLQLLLGMQTAKLPFTCLLTQPLRRHLWCPSVCPDSLLLKGHQSDWIRATLTVSFSCNHLFKDLISTFGGSGG